MIDLGLTKLAVIGAVALVVIGPEKLPRVARMAGSLYGRAQRYINDVKSEVSREIELEELRKMQKDVQEAASTVQQSIAQNLSDIEAEFKPSWSDGASVDESFGSSAPTPEQLSARAKAFRRKKLARTTSIPAWYKHRNGQRSRVLSGAARVAKFRPADAGRPRSTSVFF